MYIFCTRTSNRIYKEQHIVHDMRPYDVNILVNIADRKLRAKHFTFDINELYWSIDRGLNATFIYRIEDARKCVYYLQCAAYTH